MNYGNNEYLNRSYCAYKKPTRVYPNEPSSAKAVRYNQSVQSGHGRKGQWTSYAAATNFPIYDPDKITKENVAEWIKNRNPSQQKIDAIKAYNAQYNCGWF